VPDSTLDIEQLLATQAQLISRMRIDRRLANEPADTFLAQGAGIILDFKKHLIDKRAFYLLLRKAVSVKLFEQRDALFEGDLINITEHRSALHTLLRTPRCRAPKALEKPHAEVLDVLRDMRSISDRIRNKQWLGFS